MADLNIEDIIPHRDRMSLLGEIIDITPESAVTTATVERDWPLCDGQSVSPVILIEVVAQSAAAVEGWKRKKAGKSGGKGWLVGIKSARFNVPAIAVGNKLVTSVDSAYSFDNYGVVEGTVKCGDEILAVIVLQALRMNDD